MCSQIKYLIVVDFYRADVHKISSFVLKMYKKNQNRHSLIKTLLRRPLFEFDIVFFLPYPISLTIYEHDLIYWLRLSDSLYSELQNITSEVLILQ